MIQTDKKAPAQKHNIDPFFIKLAPEIRGDIYTDPIHRYMLSTDAGIFLKMPKAVVYPRNTEDVRQTVLFAGKNRLSVHARGSGSGLCGSAVGDGIVVDFSRYMNRLIQLNIDEHWFECQPGYRMGELESDIAGTGLFFPPDPSSGEYASFGGMCATNASGAHSVKYGNTADYLLDARVVFADGTDACINDIADVPVQHLPEHLQRLADIYLENSEAIETAYPPIRCNVAGYNLRKLVRENRLRLHSLISGAEGTLGIVTRLRFRLIPKPASDALIVAYFDDIEKTALTVQKTMPLNPSGIEVMDKSLLNLARDSDDDLKSRIPADMDNVLLIEFDGSSTDECLKSATRVLSLLEEERLCVEAHLATSNREKQKFWAVRKAAVPILYKLKGQKKILALVEDAAVPIDGLVEFFRGLYEIFRQCELKFVLYGHIAKGLLHTRPLLDLKHPQDVQMLKVLADKVFDLVYGLNGTVSGEHGDGRLRTAYIRRRFSKIYDLFLETKQALDPDRLLNPEIKVLDDPNQMTRHLRYGNEYRSRELEHLQLKWPDGISGEVEKCHGCSKCTTVTNATRMCPVYKFTRDESAAPKSKANVLRALISGAVSDSQLYQHALHNVMTLCVNCGSCFAECPSNVDIPKLTMEAKAQFARRHGSPICDIVTGHVGTAAKWLHRLSPIARPLIRMPAVKKLNSIVTGLSRHRNMDIFSGQCLFSRVPGITPGTNRRSVLYYAGCFAGYMRPEVGQAAVRILNLCGYTVYVPPQVCCGLPMLSRGMAAGAAGQIRQNMKNWFHLVSSSDAIVVTCSSCGYALIKDWQDILSTDATDGIRKKVVHVSRFILDHLNQLELAPLSMSLAYHQPCHLRLQKDRQSSMQLISKVPGVEIKDLNSHCCGMAGSWGMMEKNQVLSQTIGSQMIHRLNTSRSDAGVTDCPTCEMQMKHLGNLPVYHPVEVFSLSLKQTDK